MLELVKAIFDIIVLVILFSGVLFLAYYLTKKIGKANASLMNNKNMKLIEAIYLSQGQHLYIVKIGEEYHLFSGTKENVRYCRKLDSNMITLSHKEEKPFEHYLNLMKIRQEKKND